MIRCYVRCLSAAFCLGYAVHARAQVVTAYDRTAFFEAEAYATNTPRGGRSWSFTNSVPGFSGTAYMVVPNSGDPNSNINANVTATSPELVYTIDFPTTGTYAVWTRGYGADGTEDSIHVGLDGTLTAAGSNLTWAPAVLAWTWTNGNPGRSVTVTSAGPHTLHLWMREDGSRVDRVGLVTDPAFRAVPGNAWHIPDNAEPGIPSMRVPFQNIGSNTAVAIYNGNQFQGGGNTGNQLQVGSTIFHRAATQEAWSATAMAFFQQNGNNKYFSNAIPAGTYPPGDTVQYYLRIPYSDRLPTFLHGNDSLSQATEIESIAQADPFSYDVRWGLAPEGGYLSISNVSTLGVVEARLYTNSGHLAVVGPDLAGQPLAQSIAFAPPEALFGGEVHAIGRVLAATPWSNGVEVVQRLATTTVIARLSFRAEGVARYEVVHWGNLPIEGTAIAAASDAGEHFYGLGEKFNVFDQAGRNVRIMTSDPPGAKGDQSYKVQPWFISTRGYGFHLDSSAESFFDFRATRPDRLVVSNRFASLAFDLVYGPRLSDVLSRYTGFTGRPADVPAWAFAPWMSSDHWRSGGEVRYVVSRYRERGLAGSVFVFDSPWETAYNDLTWNLAQFSRNSTNEGQFYAGFSSAAEMMGFLRTNGFKVVCWMTPFVNTNSVQDAPGITNGYASLYAEGSNLGYFVRSAPGGSPLVVNWWKGRGSPVDFTNPQAVQWWQSKISNLVAASGGAIGGFKTDDGESGNPPGSYIPDSASYFDGRTGVEMANAYATLYHRAVWQVLGTNGVLFARSGFTGSQAYPGYWAGDNEPNFTAANGLASVVVAGQSAAMCGYALWGHDVGGYQDCCYTTEGSTFTNLFMRWTQFGAFSPIMQMHRQVGAEMQYPWSFGAVATTNYHAYSRLHTALFPYLASYAAESTTNGLPILRPLVLQHQDDASTFGINHTYYLGRELIVAAIITNQATARQVYLPGGLWCDWWSSAVYTGGQVVTWANTNQQHYPVFIRMGAIVPMISTDVVTLVDAAYLGHTNLATWDGSIEYLVYPDTQSFFRVFDGTAVELKSSDTVVTFHADGPPRAVLLRAAGAAPAGVELNGARLPAVTDATAFASAHFAWRYDAANGRTLVRYAHPGGASEVRFGPDTVGDGIPDSWRQRHFGIAGATNAQSCASCDADGDGMDNAAEYRAGTDPTNAAHFLRITAAAASSPGSNRVTVSWPGQPGIPYRVGWRGDLNGTSDWQTGSSVYTGANGVLTWLDHGTETENPPEQAPEGHRFYRLVVP